MVERETDSTIRVIDERTWEAEIRRRDGGRCRWCDTRVAFGHIYRLYGTRDVVMFDARCALLVCDPCYAKLTGAHGDNDLWMVWPTVRFRAADGRDYIDTTCKVIFSRVAE